MGERLFLPLNFFFILVTREDQKIKNKKKIGPLVMLHSEVIALIFQFSHSRVHIFLSQSVCTVQSD